MIRRPPRSTLFPSPALSRSREAPAASTTPATRGAGAGAGSLRGGMDRRLALAQRVGPPTRAHSQRSEEHTSELQSLAYLVCRLLLEKKKAQHLLLGVIL